MGTDLLTVAEVAEMLRVSRSTISRWVQLGQLPAVRLPSGGLRIRREVVERMLADGQDDPSRPAP